jgi:hypothetical protein
LWETCFREKGKKWRTGFRGRKRAKGRVIYRARKRGRVRGREGAF